MSGGRGRVAAALAFLVLSLQIDNTSPKIDQLTLATLIKDQTDACFRRLNETVQPNITGYCHGGPDYLGSCWPNAAPGQVVTLPCPQHIAFFNHSRTVQRTCGNGTWNMNRLNLTEDYPSRCYIHKEPDMTDLYTVQIIYTVGYSLSLASLTVAMGIIIRFRKLHCIRNYIHLHLFVSFILRAVFIFIKDAVLFGGIGQQTYNDFEDKIWCKIVVTLYNYFIAANYFWLLVEGLFLHSLIAVGFFSERKYFRWYMVLGWGAPWLFMIPWIAVRVTLQDTRCWEIKHLQYWWIYRGPILVSVLVNFVLFLNIVRILAVKLKQANRSREHSTQYKKLTRSTLVLIPLFGVHYIVFIGLPEDVTGQVKYVSYFFDTFMNSFQGMIVAVLYCFLNGEVQSELKRRWGLWRESRELGWERQSGLPTTTLSLVSRGSRDSPGNSPPRSPRISRVLPDSPVLLHYREYRVGDTTL
ncbi:PREDICTED: vasoactive intestinal polypeptide receptor 1-like [Branchiostoma belcheri]|uniref:Vasoactive intestinal polypeptide receptor 1-like n=1 Tax=Branchiostoma belcheri TaxID=7741 RepID=A0A6P5A9P8_BRABE|nr:PREDICTED: vasoactive intestinal polypeptide receptor 1-like [Branchiostoma belcheri]